MKMTNSCLLSLVTLTISSVCFALPTDPTRPNFSLLGTAPTSSATVTKNNSANLQAVMFNNQQKFAIINNKTYQEKQWLNSETQIVKIMPKAVILNKNGEQQTLNLNSVQIKTASKLDDH
ncbi:general secretion pathway protein GspB [Catenovulum agarivorans]|uniref:general secretion pathway protein GspB n=1 Tax=Catenovulum agarivorans TaxID=1172192 RepID=UPI0002E2CEC9|nr:general secretion pathway protein GspB [Catenovulum agarivorans]